MPSVPIDIGWVEYLHDEGHREGRFFLNIPSMGMGGLVDRHVAASKSRSSGKAKYFKAVLAANMKYKPARIRLEVDGEEMSHHLVGRDLFLAVGAKNEEATAGQMFAQVEEQAGRSGVGPLQVVYQ